MAKAKTAIFLSAVLISVFSLLPCFARQEKAYFLDIAYDNDEYGVKEISLIDGSGPDNNVKPENGFRCDLVSSSGEILHSFEFELKKVICVDKAVEETGGQTGGCRLLSEGSFSLIVPYFPTGENINIYDPGGKMILFADVSMFSDLCGDGICQERENSGNCARDCKPGIRDNYCDNNSEGVCDPDCSGADDPDCAGPSGNMGTAAGIIALYAATLLFLGFFAYFIFRKAKKAGEEMDRS